MSGFGVICNCCAGVVDNDTCWMGGSPDKLFRTSGVFATTVIDSQNIDSVDNQAAGIAYDGSNSPWTGAQADKLYLQDNQFTSTILDSQSVLAVDANPIGITYDGTDTLWSATKVYKTSGQFTSTIKDSITPSAIPTGLDWDGTDMLGSTAGTKKLYKYSGFSTTVTSSVSVSNGDLAPGRGVGITGDSNAVWSSQVAASTIKIYEQSGVYTSTLKQSIDMSGRSTNIAGVDNNGGVP